MSQLSREAMSNFTKKVLSDPQILDKVADMMGTASTAAAGGGGLQDMGSHATGVVGGTPGSIGIGDVKTLQGAIQSGGSHDATSILDRLVGENPTLAKWVSENFGTGTTGGGGGAGGVGGAGAGSVGP